MTKGKKNKLRELFIFIITILIGFFFLAPAMWAQEGVPYISNFQLPPGLNNQNIAMAQDDQGVILFANRQGILSYDGYEWEFMEPKIRPHSIGKDPVSNSIFVGLENSFGYLFRNELGSYKYIPISDPDLDYGVIEKIVFKESGIYFYSSFSLTKINRDQMRTLETIWAKPSSPYAGIFFFQESLFVNIRGKGLHVLTNKNLTPVEDGSSFDNVSIIFYMDYDNDYVLLGTDNSFLYLFNGSEFSDFILKDEDYLLNAVVTDGINLTNNRGALATLTGGCIIFNKKTGTTDQILNYQSGLPDDEIYSIGLDREGGIWLTHEFGASRVDFSLPILKFDSYKGLEGNVSQLIIFNKTLYISTSEGVFYLTEVKNYRETEVFMEVLVPSYPKNTGLKDESQANQVVSNEIRESKDESPKEVQKKGKLFSRLFQKGKPKAEQEAETIQSVPKKTVPKKQNQPAPVRKTFQTEYIRKTNLVLESIGHEFKKVEGLDAKCKQFLIFQDKLFVASNTGLYQILKEKSQYIIANSYIYTIYPSPKKANRLYVGTESGIRTVDFIFSEARVRSPFKTIQIPVNSILQHDGLLWISSGSKIIRLKNPGDSIKMERQSYNTPNQDQVIIRSMGSESVFCTSSGIYTFDIKTNDLQEIDSIFPSEIESMRYIFSGENQVWVNPGNSWNRLPEMNSTVAHQSSFLKLFDGIRYLYSDEENNLWVVDEDNHISKILTTGTLERPGTFNLYFKTILNSKEEKISIGSLSLKSKDLPLEFRVSAPCFIRSDLSEFKYYIQGLEQEWSEWSRDRSIYIPFLPPGNYSLQISSRNALNKVTEVISGNIIIEPPFTSSVPFYILSGMGLLVILFLVIQLRERKLQRDKRILEHKVKVRTSEIEKQKNEIEKQKNEIAFQKQEITDSIAYGKRIQKALMPPRIVLNDLLPEYFIFFKPRDLVSGDFYWVIQKADQLVIVVADCTGHGVPGAFLSFLGHSFLEEIANKYKITTASIFLERLRTKLKIALHQTGKADEDSDGIDMGLCILDLEQKKLQFAGAYNPLYIIRRGELQEIKADKMPIGVHLNDETSFTNTHLKLEKEDSLYMFTDGYVDQFGGPRAKKFKIIPFQQLLLRIYDKPMNEQGKILESELQAWMRDEAQVDDILVFGMKI